MIEISRTKSFTTFTTAKRVPVIVILAVLFLLQLPQYCRTSAAPGQDKKKETAKPFIQEWLEEEVKIWTSPLRMKKKSFLSWGGAALITAFLIKNDKNVQGKIEDFITRHPWAKSSGSIVTELGSVRFNIGLICSFYLGGTLLKSDRAKKTAQLSLKCLLHAAVVSEVLKRIFQRERPYLENGEGRWFTHRTGSDYRSFPSGHATTAWSVATVIAGMYKHKPAVPIICYSLATLASITRMIEKKHWASDVLVGALLGYSIGRFVLNKHLKRFKITPMLFSNKVGVSVYYLF
jgi:membrane-associated phospholipid phosphatase